MHDMLGLGSILTLHHQLYPSKEGPRYVRGHAVTMGMVAWACIVFAILWFHLERKNRQRAAGLSDHRMGGLSEDEIAELGDDSPRFVYTI